MTPEQRAARARLAAHVKHSRYDSKHQTERARQAFLDRFEREVDPEGVLDPAERYKRSQHAKRAYFQRLAMRSAEVRRSA